MKPSTATLPGQQTAHERLCVELESRRNADGGWGAGAGLESNAETTALACLALAGRSAAPDETGERWLADRQQSNGSWSYRAATPAATWPTPIVLLALLGRGQDRAVDAGFEWLVGLTGTGVSWRLRLREFLMGRQIVELDSTLDGWPWVPGTFAWVEPTSWALLALKARWPERPPRPVQRRIREGERMIADRACVDGGWNYGNKRVLGSDLPAFPDTTALALLGLRGARTPVVESGFRALDALLDAHASRLSLSLAVLSRRTWRRDWAGVRDRLAVRLESQPMPADTRTLAVAALAFARRIGWLEGTAHV